MSSPEPPLAAVLPEIPSPAALRRLLPELEQGVGARVCIVGGYVRDLLMGRPAETDVDVVVEQGSAEAAAEWLRQRWDRRARVVAFERFGTAQIAFLVPGQDRFTVEFVKARSEAYSPESRKPTVRAGTMEEDAWRRDFTLNALFLDSGGTVLDPTGRGLEDLRLGLLRTPLPPAETFSEDPLRMLRAARFVAQLEFQLAPGVEEAMTEMAPRLSIVAPERIRDELLKLLVARRPALGLRILQRTRLLAQISAELDAMVGVEQGGYHLGDVFEHTCLALDAASRERVVRLGVLFHDVGKPPTAAAGPDGPTFIGHPHQGADLAETVMRRLRFSGAEIDAVRRLVLLHMRPIQYHSEWADSAVRRLWHAAGELLPALMAVARADTEGSAYPGLAQLDELEERLAAVGEANPQGLRPPLGGEQLKHAFQLPAGPWIGRAQAVLLEAVMEGQLPGPADPGSEPAAIGYLELRRAVWQPRRAEPGAEPEASR
ncbi:MAG TPA: CCA tRNA nucleotidyltransferase [Candidatus Acidoferrales bacterium]|nr:CCA tRNA nucleotidyltransferase [Candidatus Acidoferrales bacterium]